MRDIVSQRRWASAQELMAHVHIVAKELVSNKPTDAAVGNMIRRVLRVIREAYAQCANEEDSAASHLVAGPSLQSLLVSQEASDFTAQYRQLKTIVLQNILELFDELEESAHNIAGQALEHIHADEVIMTIGHSRTVEAFLKHAGRSSAVSVCSCVHALMCLARAPAKVPCDRG